VQAKRVTFPEKDKLCNDLPHLADIKHLPEASKGNANKKKILAFALKKNYANIVLLAHP
jgi:hypothetical protein